MPKLAHLLAPALVVAVLAACGPAQPPAQPITSKEQALAVINERLGPNPAGGKPLEVRADGDRWIVSVKGAPEEMTSILDAKTGRLIEYTADVSVTATIEPAD
jgi:hypothetical protein